MKRARSSSNNKYEIERNEPQPNNKTFISSHFEIDLNAPEAFQDFLPELWDCIFHYGWFSDYKALLFVSKWFHALLWQHIKHLDFAGGASSKWLVRTIDNCGPNTIKSLLVTSYGTLHIDNMPENLREKLSDQSLVSLSSLVLQRWSLSPSEITAKHLPCLTHLTIISASASDVGELWLLSKLRSLTLRFVTEPVLQSITLLTNLESLNIGNLSEIRATHETIEYTSKNGREVTDATFHYVLQFTNLRKLHIGGLSITDRSLEKLTALSSLTFLSLTWCQRITDNGLAHLTCLTNLRELETWHSGVTADGVKKFLSSKNVNNCAVCTSCVNKPYDL